MSKFKLNRRLVISELLKERENSLIVNGLGGTCWDVASLGDNDLNFYVWGGMGNACICLLYTSPIPRDVEAARMPCSA